MFMKDQKFDSGLDKRELVMTIISTIAFIVVIGVMGWSSIEKYNTVPLPTKIERQDIARLTTAELARQTVVINEELKRRAQK